jgi:hypothetical protein
VFLSAVAAGAGPLEVEPLPPQPDVCDGGEAAIFVRYTPDHDQQKGLWGKGLRDLPQLHSSQHIKWNCPPPPPGTSPFARPGETAPWSGWRIASIGDGGCGGFLWIDPAIKLVAVTKRFRLPEASDLLPVSRDFVEPIVGSGDFNGDALLDVLDWNESRRTLRLWASEHGQPLGEPIIVNGTQAASGEPIAVARMHREPVPRVVWLQEDGTLHYGHLRTVNGQASYSHAGILEAMPRRGAALVGVDDFDRDGRTDFLWQEPSEDLLICFGPAFLACGPLDPPALDHPLRPDLFDWEVSGAPSHSH